MLDDTFSLRSTLSDIEESSLFYISVYVVFKEGLALKDAVDDSNLFKNSKKSFVITVTGESSYLPAELLEICFILLCYYKNVEKTCTKIVSCQLFYLACLTTSPKAHYKKYIF